MTETSTHAPERHSLSERDYKMLQNLRDTLDNEGSSQDPNGDMDSLPATPAEAEPVTSSSDTAPRMTDSLQEALQDFRMTNGTSGVDRAHSDALKEYRKQNYNGYIDHISTLSNAVDENGEALPSRSFNERLLKTEELKSDIKETTAKIGNIALGLAKVGYKRLEARGQERISKAQAKYEAKKRQKSYLKDVQQLEKQTEKDRLRQSKADQKEMKNAIRADERFERSMKNKARIDKVIGTAERTAERAGKMKRRIGSIAMTLEQIGRGETAVPLKKRPAASKPNTFDYVNRRVRPETSTPNHDPNAAYNISQLPLDTEKSADNVYDISSARRRKAA